MARAARNIASTRVVRGRDGGAPETPRGEETLTQEVYRKIRYDILSGTFPAGGPLRLEALKERYGLSFSPLREALIRLHAERLVVSSALRGFRVAALSVEEMRDAIETRILIDGEGLRRSIAQGDDDWEAGVLGAFHALSRCAERLAVKEGALAAQRSEEVETRHRDFHSALIAQCGSRWLVEFSAQLYAQTERYRRQAIQGLSASSAAQRDVAAEHRAIMSAAIARDAAEATRLLAVHYRRTGDLIERLLAAAD